LQEIAKEEENDRKKECVNEIKGEEKKGGY